MPRLMSSTQMYIVIAMELQVRHLCDLYMRRALFSLSPRGSSIYD